ncbi:hypothetical protein BS50DRAFT_605230 [Corynespora cassiicola Philippines]|uniref:Stress-response A/B barrel domain-containing protein n=1 Tax=Corynespora cassiicola Philippines TaxID=1448308 RepID=A0A2T2N2Z9_CORCC|nr:hypothetical protein BS50DRAFT_605230 [Corynespora cassiicola Philippines]
MASSNPKPVTRIACFKFRTTVTPEQKGDRTRSFLELYEKHPELVLGMPRGGKPLHTPLDLTDVKRESGWDTGFIVKFKDEAARRQFDAEPSHDKLKEETDPLLEQVFVYDFVEEENLGW